MQLEHYTKRKNKTDKWVFGIEGKSERGDVVIINGKHYLVDVIVKEVPKEKMWIQGENVNIYYYYIINIFDQVHEEVFLVTAKEVDQVEWRQSQLKKLLN